MNKLSIGVDIGGSHIAAAIVDVEKKYLFSDSIVIEKVNPNGLATDIVSGWINCIAKAIAYSGKERISGIGIAMPGPFDYKNGIAYFEGVAKFGTLFGANIKLALSKNLDFPESKIRFINDAAAFGIGEAWAGEAGNYSRLVAITLGTGFGSVFMDNGIPVISGKNVPSNGWVYHLPFGNGIADDYFSTRGFIDRYLRITGKNISGVKELVVLYESDPVARQLFFDFGAKLAHFLSPVLSVFQAEALVIGGNISNAYPLFGEIFQTELKNRCNPVKVYQSFLNESAALLGGARLSDDNFFKNLIV